MAPSRGRPRPRRRLLDFRGAQTGDVGLGQAAGGDITISGVDGAAMLRYLDGERASRDAQAAAVIRLHEDLAELRKEQRRAQQDAAIERAIDFESRLKRQAALDARLERLEAEQRRLRRVLVVFGFAILVALAVGALLVWERYAGLAVLRLWLGGGLALLSAGRWR